MSAGLVKEAMEKQRQKNREKLARRAKKHEEAILAREREKQADIKAAKQAKAWRELKQAFATGDDKQATKAAANAAIEMLASVWENGSSAFHSAAAQGLLGCCNAMLAREDLPPAVFTIRDQRGWTPLHCAAASADNSAEICRLIALNQHCVIGAKDGQGRTAADLAHEWGLAEAKIAILEAADERYALVEERTRTKQEQAAAAALQKELEKPEDNGASVGFDLLKEGRLKELIALLQSVWPFVNESDDANNRNRTLLHHAAIRGFADVCEAILDREDFELCDTMDLDRATALHLAAANRHVQCCIAIIASGRCWGVNLQDMRDQTALHVAAVRGDEECYNAILMADDLDLCLKDYKQRTAPDYAVQRGMDVDPPVRLEEQDREVDDPELEIEM